MKTNRPMYFPSAHIWIHQKMADDHDVDLAAESGVDQEQLDAFLSGKELIDAETFEKLLGFVIKITPEGVPPSIYLASRYNVNDLGILGNALSLAKDVRQVLSMIIRFQHLVMPAIHFSTVKNEQTTSVFLEIDEEFEHLNNFGIETVMAGFNVLRPCFSEEAIAPESVSFKHSPDYDMSYYQDFFACPIFFSAQRNELVIDNVYLDVPLSSPNISLWQILVDEVIGNPMINHSLTTQVQYMIRDALSKKLNVTREKVAAALNMSPRTLSRQLQNEDSNFREIYNEEFTAEAKRLLGQTQLSTKAIARELGFSNTAAFSRAFKGVTGVTPSEYRNQHSS